jgi:hypothetical protein
MEMDVDIQKVECHKSDSGKNFNPISHSMSPHPPLFDMGNSDIRLSQIKIATEIGLSGHVRIWCGGFFHMMAKNS